jgi:2-dehydropantoate 2-reductase
MRIAIFGTGGAGGYFGGKLAKSGEEVVFIARGEHYRAIRENGMYIDSVEGPFTVAPVRATDDPAQEGPVDVVIVGVKAWNGAVVRLGREAGVATPLNEFLYHSLLPLEVSSRSSSPT